MQSKFVRNDASASVATAAAVRGIDPTVALPHYLLPS